MRPDDSSLGETFEARGLESVNDEQRVPGELLIVRAAEGQIFARGRENV